MANPAGNTDLERSNWSPTQVYAMAAICVLLGVGVGYLFRGSQTRSAASVSTQAQASMPAGMPQEMPSLDQMKHMADKQAEPLLAQLTTDPKNADLLKRVAKIYESTHQFQQAADYYGKAIDINPKDIQARTERASCLYYSGDVDGAIAQLRQALQVDPHDANSLFNLGMIRWKGKNDAAGAKQAWNQLLKSNPKLPSDKRAQVEKLIAEAKPGATS
ncbi:MAG TPA: tetratricopeptide repeat protein [Terriglobales bacterium]|nr:tetratricopeptide repeat protein [Terriglobales bacterium]